MPEVPFTGAVLCGGASRRMGAGLDKTLLRHDGGALAAVAVAALREAGAAPVVAVGGGPAHEAALGVPAAADLWLRRGPLAGMVAALADADRRAPDAEATAVLAGDLPRITSAVVTALVGAIDGAPAAVAVADGYLQPVVAVLRSSTAVVLRAALDDGASARAALTDLGAVMVTVDPTTVIDVDTREDLARLRKGVLWA